MGKVMGIGMLAAALLYGCSAPVPPISINPPPSTPATSSPALSTRPAPSTAISPAVLHHYRCEESIEFTVRFADDSAMVEARPGGSELLLLDAGGVTPQQTVYSNHHMKAEFGLGASGREAILRYADPPLVAHCVMS